MERGSRKRSSSAGSEKMELAADREKWKDIVRQAKAHSGDIFQPFLTLLIAIYFTQF